MQEASGLVNDFCDVAGNFHRRRGIRLYKRSILRDSIITIMLCTLLKKTREKHGYPSGFFSAFKVQEALKHVRDHEGIREFNVAIWGCLRESRETWMLWTIPDFWWDLLYEELLNTSKSSYR